MKHSASMTVYAFSPQSIYGFRIILRRNSYNFVNSFNRLIFVMEMRCFLRVNNNF